VQIPKVIRWKFMMESGKDLKVDFNIPKEFRE